MCSMCGLGKTSLNQHKYTNKIEEQLNLYQYIPVNKSVIWWSACYFVNGLSAVHLICVSGP